LSDSAQQSANKRFPKSRRLLRHADFEKVYKHGRRHFAPHITVFFLPRPMEPEGGGLRIGFTVGKALGGAVQRNRIKRRLREAVRLTGFSPNATADVVINPKRSAIAMEFSELQKEVARAFDVVEKSSGRDKRP
jgi:ribonuclease P protein component